MSTEINPLSATKAVGVIYARYSSHNQKDTSIEQQVRECQAYARKHKIRIMGVYEDRAMSGTVDKRPDFQRMMKDSAIGKFQIIIAYKIDRIARNDYDYYFYKYRLSQNNVRMLFAQEHIPEGPEGILLESVLVGVAKYYSANLAQNVKRGMVENALEAKVNGGVMPFGYKRGADGKHEVDPLKAETVKDIFELYNEGNGTQSICDILNNRGVRSAKGGKFTKNSLRNLLKNERYTGVYIHGDIRVEGGMPQIISRNLFDAVQEKVKKMKMNPALNCSDVDFMLTGKLFCGHCQSAMTGASGTSKTKVKHYYYACHNQRQKHKCGKKPVRKSWIEEHIVKLTTQQVLRDDVIDAIANGVLQLQKKQKDSGMLDDLKRQYSETATAIKNVMQAIEQGIITSSTKERLVELEEQKAAIESGIDREHLKETELTKEQIVFWLEQFRGGDYKDPAYRETIIDVFVNAVYLYDDKIKIVYNYTDGADTLAFDIVENCETSSDSYPVECSSFARNSAPKNSISPAGRIHSVYLEGTHSPLGYALKVHQEAHCILRCAFFVVHCPSAVLEGQCFSKVL